MPLHSNWTNKIRNSLIITAFGLSVGMNYVIMKKQCDYKLLSIKKECRHEIESCKEKMWFKDIDKLSTWVYRHSNRISFREARTIVEKTIKISNNPILLLAIMCEESHFNPKAISKSGAIGLGQILPNKYQLNLLKKNEIIKDKRDLFDIETNIRATEFIFSLKLKKANGNIQKALKYYLGGNSEKYVNDILKNIGEMFCFITKK